MKTWMKVSLALAGVAVVLVVVAQVQDHNKNHVDQRSYDAGYHSAGPTLVSQGSPATSACEQGLEAAYLFMSNDFPKYDVTSFNNGCYAAIRANGDSVKDVSGNPVPGA